MKDQIFFESDYAKFCILKNIMPLDRSLSKPQQAQQVFEKADTMLRDAGMTFRNVIRTWLYLDNILSWYDDFNKVRNEFYTEHGIFQGTVPASTGVGMSNSSGAALSADVIAIQPKSTDIHVKVVESPLQCSALKYNISFSRAVEIVMSDFNHLYVSGTASIGLDGTTVYPGDIDRQIGLTMEVVQGILASREMGWADVSRAVAYFKNEEDVWRLRYYIKHNGLPNFPLEIAQADICREDLLFELDADAVIGEGAGRVYDRS